MVRDQITIELWEELNRLYWFVRTPTARQVWQESPSEFFQQIKSSSLLIIGLTYATLIHNEGWWFAQAGKFIERADKTSRILDLRYETLPEKGLPQTVSETDALEWSAILRSCSAWDAYKTIHGARSQSAARGGISAAQRGFSALRPFLRGRTERRAPQNFRRGRGEILQRRRKTGGPAGRGTAVQTIDEIFDAGLHGYLDRLQGKLNDIGGALFNAYIFQNFNNLEDEIMVQQEEQQQQQRFV